MKEIGTFGIEMKSPAALENLEVWLSNAPAALRVCWQRRISP